MSGAFTPRPWITDGDYSEWVRQADNGTEVCVTTNYCGATQRRANAHLIAAAPELYEAALDASEALKLLRIGMLHDRKALEMIDAHLDELNTAIAKARGEQ